MELINKAGIAETSAIKNKMRERLKSDNRNVDVSCAYCMGMVEAFLDSELPVDDMECFLDHVNRCDTCRDELKIYYVLNKVLKLDDSVDFDYNIEEAVLDYMIKSYESISVFKLYRISYYVINTLLVMAITLSLLLQLRVWLY